jgi:hypothetical protein
MLVEPRGTCIIYHNYNCFTPPLILSASSYSYLFVTGTAADKTAIRTGPNLRQPHPLRPRSRISAVVTVCVKSTELDFGLACSPDLYRSGSTKILLLRSLNHHPRNIVAECRLFHSSLLYLPISSRCNLPTLLIYSHRTHSSPAYRSCSSLIPIARAYHSYPSYRSCSSLLLIAPTQHWLSSNLQSPPGPR